MKPFRRLIGLHYSPWTEKARWALDRQRVPYAFEEHLPMLGEMLGIQDADEPRSSLERAVLH